MPRQMLNVVTAAISKVPPKNNSTLAAQTNGNTLGKTLNRPKRTDRKAMDMTPKITTAAKAIRTAPMTKPPICVHQAVSPSPDVDTSYTW